MANGENYEPGPASGAEVQKHGERWTLVLVRDLPHSPEKVWTALTDPDHLSKWAPFDADENMGVAGASVMLTTIGAPKPHIAQTIIARAEPPHVLEYKWNHNDTKWELEATEYGTRLTLWTKIDRRYIAWAAAGWHICIDAMDRMLDSNPIGRIVGPDALNFGWQRLNEEYSQQFGIEAMKL